MRNFIPMRVVLGLGLLAPAAFSQETVRTLALARNFFTSGEETMRALAPVSQATRNSIVKLNVDGETVTLGTVVGADGLVLTKASEIRAGKLTCWLANEKEVAAELLSKDEEEDLALVRVQASDLQPIQWAAGEVFIGQWAITPGVAETPHAIGIISALPRRIRPQRAFIGVQFDLTSSAPRVDQVMPGLGAAEAGLKPGDVILAVNDAPVTNREQVIESLREFRSGQTVKLHLQRGEARLEANVQMLTPKTDDLRAQFYPSRSSSRMQGEISQRAEGFEQAIEHDTVLPPWLCGGPLVDLNGKAIGLNIARAGRVTTYALPPGLVRRVLDRLESAPAKTAPKTPAAKPADTGS